MKTNDIVASHLKLKLEADTLAQYFRTPVKTVVLILEQAAKAQPSKFKKADSKYYIPNPTQEAREQAEIASYDPRDLHFDLAEQKEKKLNMLLIIEEIAKDDSEDNNQATRLKAAKFMYEEMNGRNERKVASATKLAANTLLALEVGKLNKAMELASVDNAKLLDAPIIEVPVVALDID